MILTGVGLPTAGIGAVGDFYIDKTGDDMYGPKSGTGWGPEQTITIVGTPNQTSTDFEYGVRVQFARAGRVTKVRYRRTADAATTLNVRVWNSAGTKLADVPSTQAAVAGQFEVTLPTPLVVAAADIRHFSIGTSGRTPYTSGTAATVTGSEDVTFLGYVFNPFNNNFPSTAQASATYHVEPVYEADIGPWPLALETTSFIGQRFART